MLKILLFTAAFIFIVAAGWVHTYGGTEDDILNDGISLSDGGFLLVGYTSSTGGGDQDFWAIRIDSSGGIVWENNYGGEYNDEGFAVMNVGDGFIIVGTTNSFGEGTPGYSNIYIVKIDNDGEIIWESTYESDLDDCAYDIALFGDECIVAGYTWLDFSTRDEGILLFVSADDGTIDSTLITSGASSDGFCGIAATSDGYMAAGYTKSFGTGTPSYSNVYLMKSTGEQFSIGGDNTDEAEAIVDAGSGNFIVAGETASIGAGNTDFYLLKVNSDGEIIWQKAFGGAMYDFGKDIVLTDDGIVAIGFTNSFGAGYDDLYLVKTDLDGDLLWQKTFGGMQNDKGNAILNCDDGEFLLIGATMSFGEGGWDGYVLRVNAEGDDGIIFSQKPQNFNISVSPNPFNSSCEITLSGVNKGACSLVDGTVEIYDLRGNVVATPYPAGAGFVPLNKGDRNRALGRFQGVIWTPDKSIASGIYLVRARMNNGRIMTKRVVYLK